jgi:hypothetical protein
MGDTEEYHSYNLLFLPPQDGWARGHPLRYVYAHQELVQTESPT